MLKRFCAKCGKEISKGEFITSNLRTGLTPTDRGVVLLLKQICTCPKGKDE